MDDFYQGARCRFAVRKLSVEQTQYRLRFVRKRRAFGKRCKTILRTRFHQFNAQATRQCALVRREDVQALHRVEKAALAHLRAAVGPEETKCLLILEHHRHARIARPERGLHAANPGIARQAIYLEGAGIAQVA